MSEKLQIYKCNVCGNIVEIINPGAGQLSCCSIPMEQLEEHSNDDNANEKHVPIVTIEGENKIIRVGSIPHPMEKDHYIIFIEAISPDKKYLKRKYLQPGDEPKMELKQNCNYESFNARELCNIHGLWVSQYQKQEDNK
ncbi:MAG: desulfoferrodoxin FeS4 iron-binding domain-containing protein [Candidatus Gastranaerophilales bacterium]|nr:desulfoferrodoxin FeS4 iron-binding domain-containing protein [Candidatus Gastranaerophilales bacterium]